MTPRAPCQSRGSLWLHLGHVNTFAPPKFSVDVPTPGTGFTGVRLRYFHDDHVFLLGLKPQELLEPIVRPGEHRPRRLTTKLPPRLGNHLGRLESGEKYQSVVIR